jgi:CRISPR type III-A-associated RAMP protein Csm5
MENLLVSLTPLHIGKGSLLQVSDYTVLNGRYIRINLEKAFVIVANYNKVDVVLSKIDAYTETLNKTKNNLEQAKVRQKLDFFSICKEVDSLLHIDLVKRINEISLYQIESRLPEKEYHRQIDEQLKTADCQAYIPGSTIKGALRTALLASVINKLTDTDKKDIICYIDLILTDYKNKKIFKKAAKKKLDDKLVEIVFNCGYTKNSTEKARYNDVKFDLFKLLFISDSSTATPDSSLAVVKSRQFTLSEGFVDLHNPCEAILPDINFSCDIKIDMSFLLFAKQRLLTINKQNKNDKYRFGINVWIGIKEKIKRLFDVDLDSIDENNKDEIEQKIITHIHSCCNKFYQAVLWHDRNWIERAKDRTGINELHVSLEKLYGLLDHLLQNGSILLKTGFGAGFHAKTVMLQMMLDDIPENKCLKGTIQKVFKTFEIGTPPNYNGQYTVNIEKFPTSRPLVYDSPIIDSFGWLLLHSNPLSDEQQKIIASIISLQSNPLEQKQFVAVVPQRIKEKPKDAVLAEIEDDGTKPPMVKILEGKHTGRSIVMYGVKQLNALGLKKGSSVWVKPLEEKKMLIKVDYIDIARSFE